MSSFEGTMAGLLCHPPGNQTQAAPEGMLHQASDEACNQAIAALVEQYSQPLYRVAFSVMRNAAEAEDAVQETFLRVLKNRNKLSEVRDARVWLVRITWNVVLDRKRRSKVRPETDDVADLARTLPCAGPGGERATIAAAEYRRILALIDTLPRKEREALLLSAVDELTTSEIASVLATSESSVRSRLFSGEAAVDQAAGRGAPVRQTCFEDCPGSRAMKFPFSPADAPRTEIAATHQEFDRLLAHLKASPPAAGLESRVLARLEAHLASEALSKPARWSRGWAPAAIAASLFCVFAGGALVARQTSAAAHFEQQTHAASISTQQAVPQAAAGVIGTPGGTPAALSTLRSIDTAAARRKPSTQILVGRRRGRATTSAAAR